MPPLLPVAPAPTWLRSRTTTRPARRRARWSARLSPLMPAPTTTTSATSGIRAPHAGMARQDLVKGVCQQGQAPAQRLVRDVQRREQLHHLLPGAAGLDDEAPAEGCPGDRLGKAVLVHLQAEH